ncbi:glycosyltransferase family 2 protein [Bacillus sp. FJAT-25509]|uniref:glycosyltransferase family 2 protein n=1 Tax=Bacillus sp. FJAT-25509 TaxID=1712029 RepID=UPI00070100EE|nr:glycosyltransferase family 2 protein [Bacillus sp. FJAT-25509]
MKPPLLTIIVPVYNAEKTIVRAINSIIKQSFKDFELILINDGSKDNSLQRMNEIAISDSRITVYDIPNSGASNARNYGLEHAKGKYTTFLDADDYYIENAFDEILRVLDEKTQLIIFGYNVESDQKISSNRTTNKESLQFSNKKQFRSYVVTLIQNELINAPWNKVYLTSYLKENKILFDPNLNIGEDLKFNLSVIRDIKYVTIINKALINYCVKKGEGLVSRFRINRFDIRYNIINEIKELLTYWEIYSEHKPMVDQMLIRDTMGYFMDFYKTSCKLSYSEKLERINEVINRNEIKEIVVKNEIKDFATNLIKLILRTNNSMFILFSAKIFNTRRAMR